MDETLRVPLFPRLADYLGLWAMEERSFRAGWALAARCNLDAHVLESQPAPKVDTQLFATSGGEAIAYIPVSGTLMKGASSFGGTSTVQLRREIRNAASDPNISAILLGIDSPGGTVAGTEDLAAEVRAARRKKPVWGQIEDLGASAAYWLGSQTENLSAINRTTLVGSIGTYLLVEDSSSAAEQAGVRVMPFATGPLKTAGLDGTPVTAEQAAYFQGIVDAAQKEFDAAVMRGRNLTAAQLAEVRTGAVFPAPQALDLRLIDAIRPTERTLADLAQSVRRRKQGA